MEKGKTGKQATDAPQLTRFRRQRRQSEPGDRNRLSVRLGWLSRRLYRMIGGDWTGKMALLFCLIGPVSILLGDLTGLSAAIAALTCASTAVLCAILSRYSPTGNVASANNMQQRFEQLEDMAWELSESEERYRTLAETFGDILVLRDRDGKITFSNAAFRELELPPDFLEQHSMSGSTDRNATDMLASETVGEFERTDRHYRADTPQGREVCLDKDGNARWFHWVDLPVRDRHGGGTGILSVAREITAFRQAARDQAEARQKAEEASRAKSRFLAMVSHEMRTPLNGILGMSRLLDDTGLNAEQANYNRALAHSASALLGLISDMLDMTMIEAGRFRLDKRRFDPALLVQETGEIIARRAHEKGLEFAISLSDDLPQAILSDPDRIRQIIANLAGNAVKFTSAGGVRLSIETSPSPEEPKHLVFLVRDTGSGIDAEDTVRIFNEFERAGSHGQAAVEGAGLGLAISAALARELGGEISLLETGSSGSTFRFVLPFETLDEAQPSTPSLVRRDREIAGDKKAFILSNQSFEAAELARLLQRAGYEASIGVSYDDLIAATQSSGDFSSARVFFDPQGFEDAKDVAERIAGKLNEGDQLTFCLKPDDRDWFQNLKEGAEGTWLTRPVRPQSLKLLLEKRLGGASQGDEEGNVKHESFARAAVEGEIPAISEAEVLLAEDNDINALLVVSALKRAGITVERVSNGREAVDHATSRNRGKKPYSVILMDMQMPIMNGLEAIAGIRSMEHDLGSATSPIHMLTADEQEVTREQALAAGADSVLVKPLEPEELVRLCRAALAGCERVAG